MAIVGDRIRERLIALGHDPSDGGQTWLASAVGMKPQGIQSILAGGVERPRKILDLARALRTTPEYLLGETNDPTVPESSVRRVADEAEIKDLLSRYTDNFVKCYRFFG